MAVLIVRLGEDQYVKWSQTVDAPVSYIMGRDELIDELEAKDRLAFSQAAALIDAADEKGTSDPDANLESLLATNRAGPAEARLTPDVILRRYQTPG